MVLDMSQLWEGRGAVTFLVFQLRKLSQASVTHPASQCLGLQDVQIWGIVGMEVTPEPRGPRQGPAQTFGSTHSSGA